MTRATLVLALALTTTACFVDTPPATSTETSSATSTGTSSGTSSATTSTPTSAPSTDSGTSSTGATSTTTGDVSTTTTTTTTSSSTTTDTTDATTMGTDPASSGGDPGTAGSSGGIPLQCKETGTEYKCTQCCVANNPGSELFYLMVQPCMCAMANECLAKCAATLCMDTFPDQTCYACLGGKLTTPCVVGAIAACTSDPDCSPYIACINGSECLLKP